MFKWCVWRRSIWQECKYPQKSGVRAPGAAVISSVSCLAQVLGMELRSSRGTLSHHLSSPFLIFLMNFSLWGADGKHCSPAVSVLLESLLQQRAEGLGVSSSWPRGFSLAPQGVPSGAAVPAPQGVPPGAAVCVFSLWTSLSSSRHLQSSQTHHWWAQASLAMKETALLV